MPQLPRVAACAARVDAIGGAVMAIKSWTFCGRSLVRDAFIETGTQKGDMLENAANAVDRSGPRWRWFKELTSIECNQESAHLAFERFRGDGRIGVLCGDSRELLRGIVRPQTPTTFWLDAHYCDGPKNEMIGDCECPLIEELQQVFLFAWGTPPL